ncbi:hypothetical protein, partial [Enterovibrio norvegicus]|uniref:hypothetical protein n=1 Tax=Enterovibrio norvegicus TaxID=188144 RepID=UPI00352F03F6
MNTKVKQLVQMITRIHTSIDNVEVVMTGDTTFTDGNVICINTGDPDDPVWMNAVEAKATHEAGGHIRHSDFDYLNNHCKGLKDPIFDIFNVIEDVRIECCVIKRFSGCYQVLANMTTLLFDEQYWVAPDENTDPLSLISDFLLFGGRSFIPGQQHLKVHADTAERIMLRVGAPADVLKEIRSRFSHWPELKDTQAAVKEALHIFGLLGHLLSPTAPSGKNGDEQGESQSGNDAGTGDEQGESQLGNDASTGDEQGESQSGNDASTGDEQGESQS